MATIEFPKRVVLLTNQTAVNGAPSGVAAGVSLDDFGPLGHDDVLKFLAVSVAGTGAISFSLRLWLFEPRSGEWSPAGVGDDATKGTLDAGTAMGETSTDKVTHTENVFNVVGYTRAYCELVSIAGGGGATAYLVRP